MEKINVLWFIEHIAREMDVACAIKCIAKEKYDLNIAIKHIYFNPNEVMKKYQPMITAIPFFYCSSDLAIDDYVKCWPDSIFFNLAWEEIFYKGHLKIKAPSDDFTRNKVIHHAWGEFYRKYLIESGVKDSNIFVNGNPAYQLYLSPYNKYYRDRNWLARKYRLDESKRWVFVPENYRWAFIKDGTIKWRVSQGADLKELLRMREFAKDSLSQLLKWCNETTHDSNEIIFRPKPVTMLKEMEDFFYEKVGKRQSPGLHFLKGESVREWILGSDLVISSFSTTLIEAAIANKPAFMVEPVPLIDSFDADWYEYIPRIHNKQEFENACSNIQIRANDELKAWATGEMLANGDPIEKLADFIWHLVDKRSTPENNDSRTRNFISISPRLRSLIVRWDAQYRNSAKHLKAALRQFFIALHQDTYQLTLDENTKPQKGWLYQVKFRFRTALSHINRAVQGKKYFNPHTHEIDIMTEEDIQRKVKAWYSILFDQGYI